MLTGSAPVLSTVSSCLASSSGRPLGSPSLEIEMFWPSGSCTGRSALDVLIERDGETRGLSTGERVVHHLLGKVSHLPAALRCELQANDALPCGLVELHVGPVLLERIARQVRLFVDDVADDVDAVALQGRGLLNRIFVFPFS